MMAAETMDGGEGDREVDEKDEDGDRPMEAMCAASVGVERAWCVEVIACDPVGEEGAPWVRVQVV